MIIYMIIIYYIEKFTAWRVNSTLNFTRNIYRFFKWNLTWNSLVRQWMFLYNILLSYILSYSHHCYIAIVIGCNFSWIAWLKPPKQNQTFSIFVCSASAQTKETLSKSTSMRFLILLSVSGFLKLIKNLNFNSRFGKHLFSVKLFFS